MDIRNMNTARLLDTVFLVYKKTFAHQLVLTALMSIVIGAITTFLAVFFVLAGTFTGFFMQMAEMAFYGGDTILIVLIVAFMIVVAGLFVVLKQGGNMAVVMQVVHRERPNALHAFTEAFMAFGRLFTVLLCIAVVYAPVIGLMVLVFKQLFSVQWDIIINNPELLTAGALVTIGIVLFVFTIIFIAIYVCICMAVPVCLFEKRLGFGALGKSFRLVQKDFFKVLGTLLLGLLIVVGISYSFMGILGLLAAAIAIAGEVFDFDTEVFLATTSIFQMLLSFGTNVLLSPVFSILITLLYVKQRVKHEGYDLEMQLKQMQGGVKP